MPASEQQMGHPLPRKWAVSLLAAVVVVNAVNFVQEEAKGRSPRIEALSRMATDDLLQLSFHNQNMSTRYGMYFSLSQIAPGSTVVIASEAHDERARYEARLYQVSEVSDVVISDASGVDALRGMDVRPYVVASGPGGFGGAPWAIAVAEPETAGGNPQAPDDFSSEQMFAAPEDRVPAGPPREFLMLEWPEARQDADSRYDYEIWFVDMALLARSGEGELS